MNKKIIITANNYDNAINILNTNSKYLKAIIVGYEKFSDCINSKLSIKEINNLILIAHKQGVEIYMLIDSFIYEDQINELEQLIKTTAEIKIDGIIFNDFAINQICYENKIDIKLIYNPKTLVTNYGQFDFYLKNNINSVVLPNELLLNEILEMGDNCQINNKKIEIIKQVSGYSMIMFSRWDLIKNFCEKEQINYHDLKDKKLWIKENSREFPSIILENEYGTHIFSGFCISCLKFINSFLEHNINVFLIDSFLKNDQWTLDTLNLYTKFLDNLENLNLINDLIQKEITINLPDQTSISFLGNKSDLLYLPKEKNNE